MEKIKLWPGLPEVDMMSPLGRTAPAKNMRSDGLHDSRGCVCRQRGHFPSPRTEAQTGLSCGCRQRAGHCREIAKRVKEMPQREVQNMVPNAAQMFVPPTTRARPQERQKRFCQVPPCTTMVATHHSIDMNSSPDPPSSSTQLLCQSWSRRRIPITCWSSKRRC